MAYPPLFTRQAGAIIVCSLPGFRIWYLPTVFSSISLSPETRGRGEENINSPSNA
jgi:hypothetical protein